MPEIVDRIATAIAPLRAQLPWRRKAGARLAKRVMDLAISLPAAVVATPIMAVVAGAVRVTSPGPVLFRQQRIGLDGELFTLWKFRTMQTARADGAAAGFSEVTRTDSRLTSIGAALRDWRLDELPQLFQVIAGQMSLVGPRPDIVPNLGAYADADLVRFAMPPGCTAWTFTRGAFENDWATRQAINVEYVKTWSLLLDLKVLVGTVGVLLSQRATSPTVAEVPGGQAKEQR
jgi:lipopolysaccharide/colanic/teichoic acid biosynthesis glycosyltransferase